MSSDWAGRFITIEGGEGVGKSTNIEFIRAYLARQGKDVLVTREPGGTDVAEKIRTLLLARSAEPLTEDAELLLIFAARAQHLAQVIRPALARGQWVVCDRFTDATFAYQGGGRGLSKEKIACLRDWIQQGLEPDLTLLLDAEIDLGLARIAQRGEPDRFESERREFFERVRAAYLAQAAEAPQRYRLVDASKPLERVQTEIAAALAGLVEPEPRRA